MELKNELSTTQLELQARIAQRRIKEIEAILASGVQAPLSQGIDADLSEVIKRLYDASLSDADLSSCIEILEMLILTEGLPPLLSLLKSDGYDLTLREKAAQAIAIIGVKDIENELRVLLNSPSPTLRSLAKAALTKPA